MDYTNLPIGFRVQTQIPLDTKQYIQSESDLRNLGEDDHLAYTYIKGLVVYCKDEGTKYEWKEPINTDEVLLDRNFVYPSGLPPIFGIDYSGKEYNFVKVYKTLKPLNIYAEDDTINVTRYDNAYALSANYVFHRINAIGGNGITYRNRDSSQYGLIGLNAIDFSYSQNGDRSNGATGIMGIATGLNTISSGYLSFTMGQGCTASGRQSYSGGLDSIASGNFSLAFGARSQARGLGSTAVGTDCVAEGSSSFCGGSESRAYASDSFAFGVQTQTEAENSHAEGMFTVASGLAAHAEGSRNTAAGQFSHAGGQYNEANSYAETSIGNCSTIATGNYSNMVYTDRLFNIGNGEILSVIPSVSIRRSDAFTLLKNGLATLPSVTNSLIDAETTGKAIVTKEYLTSKVSEPNTKIVSGEGTTVSGDGSETEPYRINLYGSNLKNAGWFGDYDVGGSTGVLPVSGDIISAIGTEVTPDSFVTITMRNPMDNMNYYVRTYIQSQSANMNVDNDVPTPVFKPLSTTQFMMAFREISSATQSLRIHLEIVQL